MCESAYRFVSHTCKEQEIALFLYSTGLVKKQTSPSMILQPTMRTS